MPPTGLDPSVLLQALAEQGFASCVGVPDSTLEPLLQVLLPDSRFEHLSAVNECEAVSIAMGQYLGSGQPSLVYLQNSGLGKTIHPITSLLSREICSIPVLLLIGWRGHPELANDEPQHVQMGRIMPELLKTIEVPFEVLSRDPSEVQRAVRRAREHLRSKSGPFALLVRPGLFAASAGKKPIGPAVELSRKRVLELLVGLLPHDSLYVSTTGKASRELYFIREAQARGHERDLHVVGGMGCASAIGFGIAGKIQQAHPSKTVCIVDGDGAALMQLGTLATIGHHKASNLLHLLIDNESYESTGGQPSISPTVDFAAIALACGYAWARSCRNESELNLALGEALKTPGPRLITVKTTAQSDPKLGRPSETPLENVKGFLRNLGILPCNSR